MSKQSRRGRAVRAHEGTHIHHLVRLDSTEGQAALERIRNPSAIMEAEWNSRAEGPHEHAHLTAMLDEATRTCCICDGPTAYWVDLWAGRRDTHSGPFPVCLACYEMLSTANCPKRGAYISVLIDGWNKRVERSNASMELDPDTGIRY